VLPVILDSNAAPTRRWRAGLQTARWYCRQDLASSNPERGLKGQNTVRKWGVRWPAVAAWLATVVALQMPAAAQTSATPEPAPTPAETAIGEAAETTKQAARWTAEWLARNVDSWFGDEPFADVGRVTNGRLDVSLFHRQDQGTSLDVRFDARFRLPNLERRAYVFVGRDDRRDAIQDTPDASALRKRLLAENRDDRSFLAGLGLNLADSIDLRVGLSSRAQPYAQARWRQRFELTESQTLEVRETLFVTRADRVGSTTVLNYELRLSPQWTLRSLNAATITQVSKNFDWSTSLAALRLLSGERLITAEAVFAGTGTRGTGVGSSDAGLLLKWEQPVYKSWLRSELVAGHFWPRPDADSERGRAWALGASLRLQF